MSYARMQAEEKRLAAEIEQLLQRARDTDAEEDARFGESLRGDELPQELRRREDRLKAIQEAKQRLEAAQQAADDARGRQPGQKRNPKGGKPYQRDYGEPKAEAQSNFTDPESKIMKTSSEGFQQCYNAQVAVEERAIDGYVAPGRKGRKSTTVDAEKHPAMQRMVDKLATPEGQKIYVARKWLSEAPNGWIKQVMGLPEFQSPRT